MSGEQLERREGLSALTFARTFSVWPLVEQKVTSVTRGLPLLLVCAQAYENYCKTWQQLMKLKILLLSQSKFLFQNKLWNRGWNRPQTTSKWMWRVYCLSSKDLCRATTWVQGHESVKRNEKNYITSVTKNVEKWLSTAILSRWMDGASSDRKIPFTLENELFHPCEEPHLWKLIRNPYMLSNNLYPMLQCAGSHQNNQCFGSCATKY